MPHLQRRIQALEKKERRKIMNIHPTAIISPDATLAEGVEVGPYSIIGPDVHIGKNTLVGPHVVIETQTDIGEDMPDRPVRLHRRPTPGSEIPGRADAGRHRQPQYRSRSMSRSTGRPLHDIGVTI
ncbi:MAG: hypothetical protein MZV70_48575 [Desulfobacterales bacterium]|nr:hypothetical protein [Desulfobacterales bacterium]